MAIFIVFAALFILFLDFMASHDFSSIKFPPKFDGLNFSIWKVVMTLFLKSLKFRITKAITKKFIEPHGDEDSWSEATARIMRLMQRHNMN